MKCWSHFLLVTLICSSTSTVSIAAPLSPAVQSTIFDHELRRPTSCVNRRMLSIRGGKFIPKESSALKATKELLNGVKPATRFFLLCSLFCMVIHVFGLPAQAIFALDANKIFEIWRPLTSVTYLGAPSMSMANSIYFLVNYGQNLEKVNGTGAHVWFLMVQTVLLTMLGLILGFPSLSQAMITATIYVNSQMKPLQRMPFQFGLMITSWQLAYCMMIIDCLAQQSAGAAWPHLLGIFTGHVYHFFTKIWPALGGKPHLLAPQWIVEKLGGPPSSNVGIDFRQKNKGSRKQKIKTGKGHKLGGK